MKMKKMKQMKIETIQTDDQELELVP